jgi:hypothetical protein
MAVWYQTEMLLRERQEHIERLASEARMHRLAAGRAHTPAKPRRIRLMSRR